MPLFTELAFGLSGPAAEIERDDASLDAPVSLASGIRLRGSIDLVEGKSGALRATDHKTGRPKVPSGARIAGGRSLQPALYAQALEAMLAAGQLHERVQATLGEGPHPVTSGRLSYCTQKGGFTAVDVPHDAEAAAGLAMLKGAIEEGLERGRLLRRPLAERSDGRIQLACTYCDYLVVCGPDEGARAARKKVPDALVRLRAAR
jgi:RecB family exonuclease